MCELTEGFGSFNGSIEMGCSDLCELPFKLEGEFWTEVDTRAILGECNVTCLLVIPLLVTLSIHVTLCTVLTAFLF
jgi:hypothetical protein